MQALRGRWRIPSATVEVVGRAGVPITVVKRAKERRRELKPDETWVVFDRDEHPSWTQALVEARDAAFLLAISNPCVEQWGVLLHEDQRKHLHRSKVQRRLAKVHPGYHHDRSPYFDVDTVVLLHRDAGVRAAEINALAERDEEPYRPATTRFGNLIGRLRGLKRP